MLPLANVNRVIDDGLSNVPSGSPTTIDDLPKELLDLIFSQLSLVDLSHCPSVCSKWNGVAINYDLLDKAFIREKAFGKAAWEKYFGEVGDVPRLPKGIYQMLKSPCPIWEGKILCQTHMLVLISRRVGDKVLRLNNVNSMLELCDMESVGLYDSCLEEEQEEHSDTVLRGSYWALLAKDALPGSKNMRFHDQQKMIEKLSADLKIEYHLPLPGEAVIMNMVAHVYIKGKPHGEDPWNFIPCKEEVFEGLPLAIWRFVSGRLSLSFHRVGNYVSNGVVVLRKI